MKRLSSWLFLFAVAAPAHAFQIHAEFKCGIYQVEGVVRINSTGQPLLRVQDQTSSPYELLLIVPDLHQIVLYQNQRLTAEVQVHHEIKGNQQPFVILRRWVKNSLPESEPVLLVKPAACY
jgi:hypothetical protein